VLGPEDHVPGPDLQDGRRLEGRGDGEQGELRRGAPLAGAPLAVLTVEELETALDVQRLRRRVKESRTRPPLGPLVSDWEPSTGLGLHD